MTEKSESELAEEMLRWFADDAHWMKKLIGQYDACTGMPARACLMGGLHLAGWGHLRALREYPPAMHGLFMRLSNVIREQYPDKAFVTIPAFNDHPDTTIKDVRAVIEKAAAQAREQEGRMLWN